MWIPYSVPFHVQLLTTRLVTMPEMVLPSDRPCPLPKVQLETVIFAASAEPPISRLSSPSLMEQLRIRTFVDDRSIPSVLCVVPGVLFVMFWTVKFPSLFFT